MSLPEPPACLCPLGVHGVHYPACVLSKFQERLDAPDQMFTVVYDSGDGTVVINDFGLQQAVDVRKGLVDTAVRHAAIIELEKLGYTVISPEEGS